MAGKFFLKLSSSFFAQIIIDIGLLNEELLIL
jgi:hypothetical protein